MKSCEKYMDQHKFVPVRCPICGSDMVPLDIKTCYHFCFSCANCGFQMKIDLRRVSASVDGKEMKE